MKILRVVITLALLGLIAYRLDLSHFGEVLRSSQWWWLGPAVALQLMLTVLTARRWQAILADFRIVSPLRTLIQYAFIGSFFSLCLPSSIGGDVVRAFYLARRSGRSMTTTITTTVLERNGGLCALLLIGAGASAYWGLPRGGPVPGSLFAILIGGYLLANLALFHGRLHALATYLMKRLGLQSWEAKMELVYEGLRRVIRNPGTVLLVISLSLLIQLGSVTVVWVASKAIGLDQPFHVYLLLIPIINLSIMIPVTINGLGLREGLYAVLFATLGVPGEQAVALSLLAALVVALAALPGGLAYSLYKKAPEFDDQVELATVEVPVAQPPKSDAVTDQPVLN